MSIKKLFQSKDLSLKDIKPSKSRVKSLALNKKQFVVPVDFSTPENFVKYGLAEVQYQSAFVKIYNTYPYDGTLEDVETWYNELSSFERYIFDEKYPRGTGYVKLGTTWNRDVTDSSGQYGLSTAPNYITFSGSAGNGFDYPGQRRSETRNSFKDNANIWKPSENLDQNVKLDFESGFTFEWWMAKDGFNSGSTKREVILDLWNGETGASNGRLILEMTASAGSDSCLMLSVYSGSSNYVKELQVGTGSTLSTASVGDNSFRHYAVTVESGSSNLNIKTYVNGLVNESRDTAITGTPFTSISGTYKGRLGGLLTTVSTGTGSVGYGSLISSSLDEVRIWKTRRTEEEIYQNYNKTLFYGAATGRVENYLSVYYKFNEGITGTGSIDQTIMDYSGRVVNGLFYNYESTNRNTGSALVESSKANKEYQEPTLYSFHPDVVSVSDDLRTSGSNYDAQNPTSLWNTLPFYLRNEQEIEILDPDNLPTSELKKLCHLIGTSFDDFALAIDYLPKLKDREYLSGSQDPRSFVETLLHEEGLEFSTLFGDEDILTKLKNTDGNKVFDKSLEYVKGKIYENLYVSMNSINESKGNDEAFVKALRAVGVDENLVNINRYIKNSTRTYTTNYKVSENNKRFLNFYQSGSLSSTLTQATGSESGNARSYIGFHANKLYRDYSPFTMRFSTFMPRKLRQDSKAFFGVDFKTASIGGLRQSSGQLDYTWATNESASLNLMFVKKSSESPSGYYLLTGNVGGTNVELTSSNLTNVYQDTQWDLFVSLVNDKYPLGDKLTGTLSGSYTLSFHGIESLNDTITRTFEKTLSVPFADGSSFLGVDRRAYLGAHRQNFTGSVQQKSDVGIFDFQVIEEKLTNEDRESFAKYGKYADNPSKFRKAFLSSVVSGSNVELAPEISTLLTWDFTDVKRTTDASGEFYLEDLTSGSAARRTSLGAWGAAFAYHYPGQAYSFPLEHVANRKSSVPQIKQLGVDEVSPTSNVRILNFDDAIFKQNEKHEKDLLSFEISRERSLDSVIYEQTSPDEIARVIGKPTSHYEQSYPALQKKSREFFDDATEIRTHEQFFEFYKWVDSTVKEILDNFVQISTPKTDAWNTVESHALERDKLDWKLPILKTITSTHGQFGNSNERSFRWSKEHRPVGGSQAENGDWWRKRATRDGDLTVGASVDADRETLRQRIFTDSYYSSSNDPVYQVAKSHPTTGTYVHRPDYYRNFGKQQGTKLVKGNSSKFITYKNRDMFKSNIKVDGERVAFNIPKEIYLIFSASYKRDVDVDTNVVIKRRAVYKARSEMGREDYISADANRIMPFKIYSASIDGGYSDSLATNFTSGSDITNLHQDYADDIEATQMQGTFSERFVGGRSVRHVPVNSGNDSRSTRPEEFHILIGNLSIPTGTIGVTGPDYPIGGTAGYPAWSYPRAQYYRAVRQKTPISVKNYKMTTSSFGNFTNNHQILFVNKDHSLQHWFRDNLTFSQSASPFVTGAVDYLVPTSSKLESHYVQRFSSPGGFDSNFLDYETSQYSPYNSVNYRNLNVRIPRNELFKRHSGQFGVDIDNSTVGAFHKVPRNSFVRVENSGSSTAETTKYDNEFIQHAIPRKWKAYHWITQSYTGSEIYTEPTESLRGYIEDPGFIRDYTLSGNTGSFSVSTFSQKSFNTSSFTLENTKVTDIYTAADHEMLNSYLNSEHSKFMYSPLIQTRVAERLLRNKKDAYNLFQVSEVFDNDHSVNSFITYEESPLKFDKPFRSKLVSGEQTYNFTYAGLAERYNFADKRIGAALGMPEDPKKQFVYSKLMELEAEGDFETVYGDHQELVYSKKLFPRLQNYGLKRNRLRENYTEVAGTGSNGYDRVLNDRRTFWKDTDKSRSSHLNVLGEGWGRNYWPLGSNNYVTHALDGNYYEIFGGGSYVTIENEETAELSLSYLVSAGGFSYPDVLIHSMFGTGQATGSFQGTSYGDAVDSAYYTTHIATTPFVYGVSLGRFTGFIYPYDTEQISGKSPMYDTYEDYAVDLKPHNKKYSLVSQYSNKENLEFLNGNDNKLKGNKKFLRLDGATYDASAETEEGSFNKNFFETYSFTDILRNITEVRLENKNKTSKKWKFKASALKKMLPENGFYPVTYLTQMAGVFSSSYAPYISGSEYSTHPSLALQSLMQPFYAPGMAFNAIKSGLAVDWPIFTSSLQENLAVIGTEPTPLHYVMHNTSGFDSRIPFKALYDENVDMPSNKNVYLLAPDKLYASTGSSGTRFPYVNWDGTRKTDHKKGFSSFISGTKEFFTGDLVEITSKQEKDFKPMVSGSSYYMDIILRKTSDFDIIKSNNPDFPVSGSLELKEYNGQYFGPPSKYEVDPSNGASVDTRAYNFADPAYAPYTPPYFYGTAKARIKFTATETRKYSLDEILSEAIKNVEYLNDVVETGDLSISGVGAATEGEANEVLARNSIMNLDASVELFNKIKGFKAEFVVNEPAALGQPLGVVGGDLELNTLQQPEDTSYDRWRINPIFECPALNFSGSTSTRPVSGQENYAGYGIWSTYGEVPTSTQGIFLEVVESFDESEKTDPTLSGSLIDICGFENSTRQIGTLKEKSQLSEGLVVIPFVNETSDEGVVEYDDKFFFKMGEGKLKGDLLGFLNKYNLPPKYDFLKQDVEPFLFIPFEFHKDVQKGELADMWQGLLPSTLRYAEEDSHTFEIDVETLEEAGIKELPDNVQFMVFRVKKKSHNQDGNYYNWPHDYYTLIENVNLEVDIEFKK